MSLDLWRGDFGNQYTERNRVETIDYRSAIWSLLLPPCGSILEVGANVGQNLEAISKLTDAKLLACEPNDKAREQLVDLFHNLGESENQVTGDSADKLSFKDGSIDLVFTSGVLIHIPPDKLLPSMREIHRVSAKYIICGEYFAPQEEMIPYRGQDNALWRRDYGGLYLDHFPDLHCVVSPFFAWKRATGLDNLVFWVFEKGARRH